MAGVNPYMDTSEYPLPQTPYKLKILPVNEVIEVTPEKIANNSQDGLPGSILSIASEVVDMDHSCGGVCACSTCHIFVHEGLESCNEASADEEDMLDLAPGLKRQSRLACQCVPDGTKDIVIEIPNWNRNLFMESH